MMLFFILVVVFVNSIFSSIHFHLFNLQQQQKLEKVLNRDYKLEIFAFNILLFI
jgi:hypothetical protein